MQSSNKSLIDWTPPLLHVVDAVSRTYGITASEVMGKVQQAADAAGKPLSASDIMKTMQVLISQKKKEKRVERLRSTLAFGERKKLQSKCECGSGIKYRKCCGRSIKNVLGRR